MTSHELAKKLLDLPDLLVATSANNHEYFCGEDTKGYEGLRIGRCHHYTGDHILIGNFHRVDLNPPNWYVKEILG